MKQKIQQGYLNKERAKQMAEKQVRKVDELVKTYDNIDKRSWILGRND